MEKSWIVGKKEFLANLLSIRFLIVVLIFSILFIGATYGQTLSTRRQRETTHILLGHHVDLEGDGDYDDIVVYYSDEWGNPIEGRAIYLHDMLNISLEEEIGREGAPSDFGTVRITDENGMAVFENIKDFVHEVDEGYHNYTLDIVFSVEDQDKIDRVDDRASMQTNFRDNKSVDDFFSTGSFFNVAFRELTEGASNDALYHSVEPDGSPSSDAELFVSEYLFSLDLTRYNEYIENGTVDPVLKEAFEDEDYHIEDDAELSEEDGEWVISVDEEDVYFMEVKIAHGELEIYGEETKVAEADGYGYLEYGFPKGIHRVRLQNEYDSWTYTTHEIPEDPDRAIEIDSTLNNMTFIMILVLPLIAIALSFDSVSGERETNSLFFLLVKPIERWKIGLGKLIGSFSVIAIPVILINSISISLMWYMLGDPPSLDLVLTFFLGSLAILVFFLTLQTILSTLTDSSVTSLLGGLGFWFILSLFYPAIEDGIAILFGFEYGSYNYEVLMSYMVLANPNMIFLETMEIVYRGRFGLDFLPGITDLTLIIAMLIWTVGFVVLFLFVFQKRLVRD